MEFVLRENKFKMVEEGEQILKIKEASAKPQAKPQFINLVLEDDKGATIKSDFDLNKEIGSVILSIVLKLIYGDIKSFDIDNIKDLEGKFVKVEIKHTEKESTNDPTKTVKFANIKKWISKENSFSGSVVVGDDL